MSFTALQRPTGPIWLHNTKPIWIVHYRATLMQREHYQAYKSIAKVPKGRDPWSVDNRRMSADGWLTLEEAMEASCA